MYSGLTSQEILGLEIGKDTLFLYEDQGRLPGRDDSPRFDLNLADGQ